METSSSDSFHINIKHRIVCKHTLTKAPMDDYILRWAIGFRENANIYQKE